MRIYKKSNKSASKLATFAVSDTAPRTYKFLFAAEQTATHTPRFKTPGKPHFYPVF